MEKRLRRKENIALTHSTLAAKAMRELNWKPGQSVELSVLGDTESARPGGLPARILELSGKQMRLAASVVPETGAAVSLEWDGQLLLGEVLNGEPGGFWIEIHHMLLDTAALDWQKQGWQRLAGLRDAG